MIHLAAEAFVHLTGVGHGAQSGTTTTTAPAPCTISAGGAQVNGLCTATGSLHIPIAYRSILPLIVVLVGSLLLLTVSAVLPKRAWPGLYATLTVLIGLASGGAAWWQWNDVGTSHAQATIGQQILYDRFSVFFMVLISSAIVLAGLFSDSYLRRERLDGVEAYVLLLLAAAGAMLMAASAGLIMLFLGLEIMSIALYVMTAYHRRRTQSGEAGFKYFILGSFSSAIFLYGVALVYGATGSTQFGEIATFLDTNTLASNGVLLAGMAFLVVGMGFKVAAVPFHYWTPDVYQGAPTPFTGFMAAVAKAGGFAGLIRILTEGLPTQQSNWRPIIWMLAVLTLIVGSVVSLTQKDLKRALAFSSISQAGYVLVGVQTASSSGTAGALFYLLTYVFIIAGTFAVVAVVQGEGEARNDLGAIRGLARRRPALAAAMLVLLLAQAGVPFTSGFLAKFYVISAAVSQGQYVLAIIAMLAAAVAAFFYLRVALLMYATEPAPAETIPATPGTPAAPAARGVEADDGTLTAGLAPVATLDPPGATAALEDPPTGVLTVPWAVWVGLAICVVVTIGAGVSSPLIDFARDATLLF